jgi:hypothetical protein
VREQEITLLCTPAGIDVSMTDALNLFDEIGIRYTFFPFNFTSLVIYFFYTHLVI